MSSNETNENDKIKNMLTSAFNLLSNIPNDTSDHTYNKNTGTQDKNDITENDNTTVTDNKNTYNNDASIVSKSESIEITPSPSPSVTSESVNTSSVTSESVNNLVDIILEVLSRPVNNNVSNTIQDNTPVLGPALAPELAQPVPTPVSNPELETVLPEQVSTSVSNLESKQVINPESNQVLDSVSTPNSAIPVEKSAEVSTKQYPIDTNINNFVDTIIEILTKQGNNQPKQEEEKEEKDDIKVDTDGSVDDLVNLIIGVLSNSSNVSPPQTRLQNFKNSVTGATSSAVDVAKSLGNVAVRTGRAVGDATSTSINGLKTLSKLAMDKLLEQITNDEPVSKNTKFVSILNKAMRKVDSKCDLIVLIHSIETLLKKDKEANQENKSEDKLSDPDRRFYENILPILKTKVTSQIINNKPNNLSVTLSETDNNNITGDPIVNDTENTIRNLFIQDDDNNNNNNGLTFWSQMIGPTNNGRRTS